MKNKLHITLTDTEIEELREMQTYFTNMLSYGGIKVPVSYSWLIGSAIRECHKTYFNKKTD